MSMSISEQLSASLTGNIETALLVIHDYREKAKALTSGQESKLSTADALAKINSSVVSSTKAALLSGEPPTYTDSKELTLKVQFNPAELTINASAVPKSQPDATTGQSRTMSVEDAKLNLTVMLYFDDTDTYDAFMWDKFTAGLSVSGISNIVKTVAGTTTHSVQGQVESLVAALRNPFTRMISFRWADFSFIGQLNTVRANYTMFSTSGRPIRAQVLLRIQHEMDPIMLDSWYESFDTAFDGTSSNLVTKEQDVSALLNLNL